MNWLTITESLTLNNVRYPLFREQRNYLNAKELDTMHSTHITFSFGHIVIYRIVTF